MTNGMKVIDGILHQVVTGRFTVSTEGARWDGVRAESVKHHGPWSKAWGRESAASFAASMGAGHVRVIMLDGTVENDLFGRKGTEDLRRMEYSRVEVREVAPYAYSLHYGRLTSEQMARAEDYLPMA